MYAKKTRSASKKIIAVQVPAPKKQKKTSQPAQEEECFRSGRDDDFEKYELKNHQE